ncbi:WXG100 family type VII secretion target [Nonomuraea gerenzanensis]|uniref:WXG100 family type VII secretion target n=1 Tax=Nonomuraea gerenzanensis TaxID=93944 RepID=UPI001CD9E8B4|nr:WXG100 family type VII secretion target [Nonomuraea gerenzanensis]UBU12529.1 WXG100 family type VII secretion target [Nonomuraea gerenzanensis]
MPVKHQLLREAGEKDALATTFTRYAKHLADTFAGIPSSQAEAEGSWKGPAAERYLAQGVQLRREMSELENSCLATAENLRHRAEELRKEAAQAPDPM